MVVAKDRGGQVVVITFHLRSNVKHAYNMAQKTFKPGHTIAIMDAERYLFMTGDYGILVDDMKNIKV
jgi:hypothetical protein